MWCTLKPCWFSNSQAAVAGLPPSSLKTAIYRPGMTCENAVNPDKSTPQRKAVGPRAKSGRSVLMPVLLILWIRFMALIKAYFVFSDGFGPVLKSIDAVSYTHLRAH